jgi:transcriptional regulator with XRE-family HTH domain
VALRIALREMRNATGMTGDELTQRLGWKSRSKVPKLENGRQMPSEDDLRQWAEATGQPGRS